MSETYRNPDYLQIEMESSNVTLVRRRGRPKGSKNKVKAVEPVSIDSATPQRRRGRPPGAKNKPKSIHSTKLVDASAVIVPKRRGRPPGTRVHSDSTEAVAKPLKRGRPRKEIADSVQMSQPNQPQAFEAGIHPLMQAAKWIEKKMEHPAQVNYYRRRMASMGTSMQAVIAIDILGLFNISDVELRKQIKTTTTEQ
jgi:hypothetical protein